MSTVADKSGNNPIDRRYSSANRTAANVTAILALIPQYPGEVVRALDTGVPYRAISATQWSNATKAGNPAVGVPPVAATLATPVIEWDHEGTDPSPDFLITTDLTIVTGDVLVFQRASNPSFSSGLVETSHTITSGEEALNEINLGLANLALGVYYCRAKLTRGAAFSDWSNVETVTIANQAPLLAGNVELINTGIFTTVKTTAAVSIGAASPTRKVYAFVFCFLGGGNTTINAVEFIDQFANVIPGNFRYADNRPGISLHQVWSAVVPLGTTVQVRATFQDGTDNVPVGIMAVDGVAEAPVDFATAYYEVSQNSPYPTTTPITVPAGGLCLAHAVNYHNAVPAGFANLTLDEQIVGSPNVATAVGHGTVSVTPASTGFNGTYAWIAAIGIGM